MNEEFKKKALAYHSERHPGKTATVATKPVGTPTELSFAYTPGVAVPAMEIARDRWKAYRYTNKGNLVAVVSNGSSLLGLGNSGALASKPVMEGKAMLFKSYADIDAFDIELSDEEPDRFIATVQALAPTFGGINLEDIKAPDCFYIEQRLRSLIDIPVLHDDQHGTAVTLAAALMNACIITGRNLKDTKIVICGAGAAALSSATMLTEMGVPLKNLTMVDNQGVINSNRTNLSPMKAKFAITSKESTLLDAMRGADAFIGLSRGNLIDEKELSCMAPHPIIFALANPTPEISYIRAKELRADAIAATGRSDSPNQINNLLAFPYLFRGALDTLSTTINEAMKIAAATAIAQLARKTTPKEIEEEYGSKLSFGQEYILPKPSDHRLLGEVASAVAKAAMESGVARRNIASFAEYRRTLQSRIDNANFFARETVRHRVEGKLHSNNRFKRETM